MGFWNESVNIVECHWQRQEDVEEPPPIRKRSRPNQKAPTRGHIANLLGLKTVTLRSIAYVAVQVSFPDPPEPESAINTHLCRYALRYRMLVPGTRTMGILTPSLSTITFLMYFETDLGHENRVLTTSLSCWTSSVHITLLVICG